MSPTVARRGVTLLAMVSLCATGAAVLAAAPAANATAAPKVAPRDPISSKVSIVPTVGGLTASGWVSDPDAPTRNVRVSAVLDGTKSLGSVDTSLPNAGATKRYATGPTPGYSLTVPVPTGNHVVCVVFGNFGGGLAVVKKCVATPLGRQLTAKQVAKRSPKGAITSATASASAIRLVGWASDPDYVGRPSQIVTYLNGRSTKTRQTSAFAAPRPTGAGASSRFDISLTVPRATQIACVWVLNVGIGSNKFLGCQALDPRASGAASTARSTVPVKPPATPPVTPAINAKVVKLAKKQIGKPYVWAAAGPKSFDCSGLVIWSYGKYGLQTPRVSQDQIKSARLIPASRAVPGDLVFYHDNTGDVYHVGIYLSPGLSVAAIDTQEGVNYQQIWDQTATYGSFTHT